MCFNWKVLAGLAGVGLAAYVAAPDLASSALPLLVMAACPLSMLLMGKSMIGSHCATTGQEQPHQQGQHVPTSASAASAGAASAQGSVRREQQLAQLRTRLAGVQAEQAALAEQVEALAAADESGVPRDGAAVPEVVTEAEAIVRAKSARDEAPTDAAGGPRMRN